MRNGNTEGFSDWKRKVANRKPERVIKNRLLSVNDLLDKLGISRTTLYNWRKSGKLPEGRRIAGSNLVKWSESTIDQWIKEEGL